MANDPILFMRENIKGKSDISTCDHGAWFLDVNGECDFIEGNYIINRMPVVLTCSMLRYIKENAVANQFNCQNCDDPIMDIDLTEFLLCKKCANNIPQIVEIRGRKNGTRLA